MTTQEPFNFNGVSYSAKPNFVDDQPNFIIKNPKRTLKPEFLFKYYGVSNCLYRNSIDAFLNHYLYASHPLNLNDKYDCCGDLIDYSKLSIDVLEIELSENYPAFDINKIRELYKSNKRFLEICLAEYQQQKHFMKIGVISLTDVSDDILMWSNYSQNSGFVLKLRTSFLPQDWFGPFPINYSENFQKINIKEFDILTCILYQSNLKHNYWGRENEWRYLTYIKNGEYHPYYNPDKSIERRLEYNPKAIEEVILGYDFFGIKELERDKHTQEYDIVDISKSNWPFERKSEFLDYIIDNSIKCTQIKRYRDSFTLECDEKKIEKVSKYEFKVIHTDKKNLFSEGK